MKARYPWVAVRTDLARVGSVASDTYAEIAQRIVGRNLQCFARGARDDLRRPPELSWAPDLACRQVAGNEMAEA